MLMSGEQLDVFPAFKEGTPVPVKHGLLHDAAGIPANREGCRMFLIKIETLGRSVGVKICTEDGELGCCRPVFPLIDVRQDGIACSTRLFAVCN